MSESQERDLALFENMTSGVAVFEAANGGEDFIIVDFNRAAERIEQIDRQQVIGRRVTDVFPGVGDFGLLPVLRRVWESGESEDFPQREYRDNRVSGWRDSYLYKLPSGEVVAVYDDVTDRVRAEDDLRAVLDLSPFPVAVVDTNDDQIFYWSRSAQKLFGHTPGTSQEWYDLAYPDPEYQEDVIRRWRPATERAKREGGAVNTGRYNVTCADGRVVVCEIYAQFLADRLIVTLHDVTKRVKAEENLQTILDASPFPVAVVDVDDDQIFYWSQSAKELFGHTPATSKEWYEVAYPDPDYLEEVLEKWRPAAERAKREGRAVNTGEYKVTCADGRVLICEIYAQFLADRLIVTLNNVTERVEAEQATAGLLTVIEESPDFVGTSDLDGNLLYHNVGAKRMVGLPEDSDLTGMRVQDMHPSWAAQLVLDQGIPAAKQDGTWRGESALLHRDGHEVPVSQVITLHRDAFGDPEYLSTIMRDITEPKAIEQERAQYRENLEDEVRRRTSELQTLVKAMTGRELRMAELKKENEELRARLGGDG